MIMCFQAMTTIIIIIIIFSNKHLISDFFPLCKLICGVPLRPLEGNNIFSCNELLKPVLTGVFNHPDTLPKHGIRGQCLH